MNKKQFKILSIFSGAGGLDLGFHGDFNVFGKYFPKLPFETIFASDINIDACNTLEYNSQYFSNAHIECMDITLYDHTKIKEKPDVLLGGFPCVTFSVVGKQAGITDDINGTLYESYARYVEYFQPKVFLAENVKGILSANKGEAIKIIKKRFEKTGYTIHCFSVNFADFGVPQLRHRVLLIGIRNDITLPFIPPQYTSYKQHMTVEEAFLNISNTCPNHTILKQNEKTRKMLELIPEGGNYQALKNTPYEIKGLMSNIYRRLKGNEPAYTVIASGGGGTWTYHHKEPRSLTNRERARLQSFPDDFIFQGSTTEIRRQIGNAVPPVGIYPFAKSIASLLQYENHYTLNLHNCIQEIYIEAPLYSSIQEQMNFY